MVSRIEKNKVERKKIEKEEKKRKSKERVIKTTKRIIVLSSILAVLVLVIYYTSTRLLIVREYSPTFDNLPEEFNGFKIVQFGDIYYDNNYDYILDRTVNKINEIEPDLVVFTGGLISKNYIMNETTKERITNKLKKITSNTSIYYVVSSSDNEQSVEILNKAGFTFLDDSCDKVYFNGSTPISIIGINKSTDIKYEKDLFNIVLVNDSKKIDTIMNSISSDLILSGKNLNGQLRIPYYGSILKRNEYVNKHYSKDNTEIYVTGGIGTNNVPVRLFNPPSINLYRIRIKK